MAIEVTIPRLGWSMDEATFVEWFKADGDSVEAGDPIFSLESDKAIQDVESIDRGILRLVPSAPQKGQSVVVGLLVGYLLEPGEEMPEPKPPATTTATADTSTPIPSMTPIEPSGRQSVDEPPPGTSLPPAASPSVRRLARSLDVSWRDLHIAGRITDRDIRQAAQGIPVPAIPTRNIPPATAMPKISPRARRLAGQLGVNWMELRGAGRTGRIRERDVRAAAAQPASIPSLPQPPTDATRRAIAARMLASVQSTAPVTLTTRLNATPLVQFRQSYKDRGKQPVPSYQDVIAILTAKTLVDHAVMNRQKTEHGWQDPLGIHLGLAVDTPSGLIVPVLRNADRMSLDDWMEESNRLIVRARQRQSSLEELQGGTFTITNLGAFGIDAFTPIINPPQTAILGIGAIRLEATVTEDGQIQAQHCLTLSLTFDHCAVDGAPAAKFLQQLCRTIEQPDLLRKA